MDINGRLQKMLEEAKSIVKSPGSGDEGDAENLAHFLLDLDEAMKKGHVPQAWK